MRLLRSRPSLAMTRKKGMWVSVFLFFILMPSFLHAQEKNADEKVLIERSVSAIDIAAQESPQMWSIEVKTGFWIPKNAVLDEFFTPCCNLITRVEGGLLLRKRYGVEGGVGFMYKTAAELGANTGRVSEDRFSLILVPGEINFVWRVDYFDWRYIVPFTRNGFDAVYYRQGSLGKTIQGVKCGLHGGGGVAINISEIGDVRKTIDSDAGINDLFVTLEARYQWINNFGAKGMDFSGGVYSIGLLFEF